MSTLPTHTSLNVTHPDSVTTELKIHITDYEVATAFAESTPSEQQLRIYVGAVVGQVLREEELSYIGDPQISFVRSSNGGLDILAVIGSWPTVKLVQYKGLNVKLDYTKLESKSVGDILGDVAAGLGTNLASLDVEQYQELGIPEADLFELHKRVKLIAEQDSQAAREKALEPVICMALLHTNGDFELPQVLIDDRIRMILVEKGVIDTTAVDAKLFSVELYREMYSELAQQRLRLELILDEIIKAERIAPNESQLNAEIARMATAIGVEESLLSEYMLAETRILTSLVRVARILALRFVASSAIVSPVS